MAFLGPNDYALRKLSERGRQGDRIAQWVMRALAVLWITFGAAAVALMLFGPSCGFWKWSSGGFMAWWYCQ